MPHISSQTAVFLLRCWVEFTTADNPPWRFRLENPHTGDAWHFANLSALYTFLNEHLDQINQNTKEIDQ